MTIVSYQGEAGAFSHLACLEVFDPVEPLACPTFEAALSVVERGDAERAMIPVENSVAGRVADIHNLLPGSHLFIVGEHFQPVRHSVLAPDGADLASITTVYSHPMALAQCRNIIAQRGWTASAHADTAGAARMVAEEGDPAKAALASSAAAETYQLNVVAADVQDDPRNTTRFVVMAREPRPAKQDDGLCVTALLFNVRNVPAALYKVLGGFATNGVNMTKLESYLVGGDFSATQFYAEVEGRPDEPGLAQALDELQFFSTNMRIFGVFPAHPERKRTWRGPSVTGRA